MAQAGVNDIFVSNEVVGVSKLRRLAALTQTGVRVSIAVDNIQNCTGAWQQHCFLSCDATYRSLGQFLKFPYSFL